MPGRETRAQPDGLWEPPASSVPDCWRKRHEDLDQHHVGADIGHHIDGRQPLDLGAAVEFVSVVGRDPAGHEVMRLVGALDRVEPHLLVDTSRPTTIKTRYIADGHQMLRADRESSAPVGAEAARDVVRTVEHAIADCDVVVLSDYAKGVLTPRLMQLRRLVIGEVARFPELARVLYERGPQRAIAALAQTFERLAARGLLVIDDPLIAASHFNWLVMSEPLNKAMLLGDAAIPKPKALRRYAAEGVRIFLAAYGRK